MTMIKRCCKMIVVLSVCLSLSALARAERLVGQVMGVNVNVRAGHTTKARVLGRVSKPEVVEVLGTDIDWVRVRTKRGFDGWMSGDYVLVWNVDTGDVCVTGTNVSLRAELSDQSRELASLSWPNVVTKMDTAEKDGEQWTKVTMVDDNGGDIVGWVKSQFVDDVVFQFEFSADPATVKRANVRVYAEPSAKAAVRGTLSQSEAVLMMASYVDKKNRNTVWYCIRKKDGLTGWVNSDYLDDGMAD